MKKLPRKNCLNCGKPCKRTTTKYCSLECRTKHWKKNKIHYGGPKRKYTLPRSCVFCKKNYTPWNKKQKYCSRHCAAIARRDEFVSMNKKRTGPRNLSIETRKRMSIAATKRNTEREYTKGIGGTRPDIGHYVRSRWEANIARILKQSNISYKYEPHSFSLIKPNGNPLNYTPDFKINSWYIEVKGWWDTKSKLKKILMEQQYPHIKIYIINESEYINFERKYSENIYGWERKK